MKPVSLADITYKQALQTLEMRKQALDSGQARHLPYSVLADSYFIRNASLEALQEKQAAGFLKNLGQAFNKVAPSRTAKSALIGGGAGLLGGFGKTVMDEDDDNYAGNMLTGGLGGAALGGGIGFALDPKTQDSVANRIAELSKSKPNKQQQTATKPKEPSMVADAISQMNGDDPEGALIRQRNKANPVFQNTNGTALGDSLNRNVNAGNVAAASTAGLPATALARQSLNKPHMSVDPVLNIMKSPMKTVGKTGLASLYKGISEEIGPLGKRLDPSELLALNKELGLFGKDALDIKEGTAYRYLNDKKNTSSVKKIFKKLNLLPGTFTGMERGGVQANLEALAKDRKQVFKKTKSFSLSRLLKDILNERSVMRPAMQAARRAPKGRAAVGAGILAGSGALAKQIYDRYGAPAAAETRKQQDLLKLMETVQRLRDQGVIPPGGSR